MLKGKEKEEKTTQEEIPLTADEQKGDDKEHSESLDTHSIDKSDVADEDSNILTINHEAASTQEVRSIMIGRTTPIETTHIEKSPSTKSSKATPSNFAATGTSSNTTTNPSVMPGSNEGKKQANATPSTSLEDEETTRRGPPPADVFLRAEDVADAEGGSEQHDNNEQDSCHVVATEQDQDAVVENEEKDKDRKRIERNKRERMRAKERAKQKRDKNKEMSNEIQNLQKENEQLRKKIDLLFDELSTLIPQEKVEVVRQNLSLCDQTLVLQQEPGGDGDKMPALNIPSLGNNI